MNFSDGLLVDKTLALLHRAEFGNITGDQMLEVRRLISELSSESARASAEIDATLAGEQLVPGTEAEVALLNTLLLLLDIARNSDINTNQVIDLANRVVNLARKLASRKSVETE